MEETKVDKIKNWFGDKKDKVKKFCSEHPDVVLTVVGGLASVVGGCIKLYASKSEYENYVYTVTDKGNVYKVPAKRLETAKGCPTDDEDE